MDSSVSPTHGDQEGTAYNGLLACTCYHPLFVFNQFGDLERCALRSTSQITGHRRPRRRRLRRGHHRRRPSPNPFVQPFNGDRPVHMQIRPTRWRIRGPQD